MADNPLDKEIRAKVGKDDPEDLVECQHQIGPPKGAHQGSADGCSKGHAANNKTNARIFQGDEKKIQDGKREKKDRERKKIGSLLEAVSIVGQRHSGSRQRGADDFHRPSFTIQWHHFSLTL